MKKNILFVLIIVILITGCNKIPFRIKVTDKIKEIKIDNKNIYKDYNIVNDNSLENLLGINKNTIEKYAIMYTDNELIAIIKVDTKYKDDVLYALKLYKDSSIDIQDKTILEEQYKDYLIYIVSSNSDTLYNEIKNILKES